MFNILKKKLSEVDRLEIGVELSTHFDNLVHHCEESLIALTLESVLKVADKLSKIPEGDYVEVHTLKHDKLKVIKEDGTLTVRK